jgi:hypothetical protein
MDRYRFKLEHRAGTELVDADAMTRMYKEEEKYVGWGLEHPQTTWIYELVARHLHEDWGRVKLIDYGGPVGARRLSRGGRMVEVESADDFLQSLEKGCGFGQVVRPYPYFRPSTRRSRVRTPFESTFW